MGGCEGCSSPLVLQHKERVCLVLAEGPGQPLVSGGHGWARREPGELERGWRKAEANLFKDKTAEQKVGLLISVLEVLNEIGYTSPIYI